MVASTGAVTIDERAIQSRLVDSSALSVSVAGCVTFGERVLALTDGVLCPRDTEPQAAVTTETTRTTAHV
jgi:hypothetical protein